MKKELKSVLIGVGFVIVGCIFHDIHPCTTSRAIIFIGAGAIMIGPLFVNML